jgi:amino acid adenylation domain-containing protein
VDRGASLPGLDEVTIDGTSGTVRAVPPRRERRTRSAVGDAAYVFFTSGTTGKPKGVLGIHQGLAHFLHWQRERFSVGVEDRAAQLTGLSFDVVMRDIFTVLGAGGTLCFPPASPDTMAGTELLGWLRNARITMMHSVPSLVEAQLATAEHAPPVETLRLLFLAGEPLTDATVRRCRAAFPNARIVNLYGPTETTLAKCFYEVPATPRAGVQPVGEPIPDTQALIVTPGGVLCGVDEAGEIWIRTPFRTAGYLRDVGASRFRASPFRADAADVVYATGDRGRYLPDGRIEIRGRLDDQVKILGVRVEPAEVAAVLRAHSSVSACFVSAPVSAEGRRFLCAYVVCSAPPATAEAALRAFLAERLPPALVPSAFVFLAQMPLTANGKVDRRALPAPDLSSTSAVYVAPRDETEALLARSFGEVLAVRRVGIHDDFFALGGHSLKAAQLAARINRELNVKLTIREVFSAPTVAKIARLIASAGDLEIF